MVSGPSGDVLGPGDERRVYAHACFAFARVRFLHVLEAEHVGPAEFVHDDRLHQCSSISGLTGPHLFAAPGLGSHTRGPCGNSSCHGRGSKNPASSSKIMSISVNTSTTLPSGSRW